ncbi:MAG: hypothetical protein L6428_08330 [Candidatus Aminicenantes bacterium]|nr:hypothetical protein [Candidatus Aminicenantes bacterium]
MGWKIAILVMIVLGVAAIALAFGGKDVRVPVQWITDAAKAVPGFAPGPGDYGRKLKIGGQKRFYQIHVPGGYAGNKAHPVVLVFHGGGGDPGSVRYESGMDGTADREGFIVVYPAGTNKRLFLKDRLLLWNDGRPDKDGAYSKVDDVGYTAAILDDLGTMFNVDKRRVYACGYSNGAQFTYRLAKRLSQRIAAIAVVAGHRPVKDEYDPVPSRPISVMQFSGTEDKLGPYYGGRPPERAALSDVVKPVKETIKSWVDFDKCPPEPTESKKIGLAVMHRYGPCQDGAEVVLWTLEHGGHTWPGGRIMPNVKMLGLGNLGNINRDINASDLMWDFFKRHPLK